jgi:hypothetical protein
VLFVREVILRCVSMRLHCGGQRVVHGSRTNRSALGRPLLLQTFAPDGCAPLRSLGSNVRLAADSSRFQALIRGARCHGCCRNGCCCCCCQSVVFAACSLLAAAPSVYTAHGALLDAARACDRLTLPAAEPPANSKVVWDLRAQPATQEVPWMPDPTAVDYSWQRAASFLTPSKQS